MKKLLKKNKNYLLFSTYIYILIACRFWKNERDFLLFFFDVILFGGIVILDKIQNSTKIKAFINWIKSLTWLNVVYFLIFLITCYHLKIIIMDIIKTAIDIHITSLLLNSLD